MCIVTKKKHRAGKWVEIELNKLIVPVYVFGTQLCLEETFLRGTIFLKQRNLVAAILQQSRQRITNSYIWMPFRLFECRIKINITASIYETSLGYNTEI